MENIYRGYPQALHATETGRELKPYMLYRREEQSPREMPRVRQKRQGDWEYFRGLYPQSMRRCQSLVEEGCDRYDYPGSPIYDEYPDRVSLYGIRDGILRQAKERGVQADRDLTQLLLLLEIQRRREK